MGHERLEVSMAEEFFAGQRVTHGTEGSGTIAQVINSIDMATVQWDKGGHGIAALDILTPIKEFRWRDVKAGDEVTFQHRDQWVTVMAYEAPNGVSILGQRVNSVWVATNFILTNIIRYRPALPTKPGTALKVEGISGLVHRRANIEGMLGEWVGDSGTFWSDSAIRQREWMIWS